MHGSLSCPVCGTVGIALGSPSCPGCHVAFSAPVVAPTAVMMQAAPPAADPWTPTMQPPTAQAPAADVVQYASIWNRLLAGIIDVVIVSIPFIAIQGRAYFDTSDSIGIFFTNDPLGWVETLVYLVYAAAFQSSSKQATLGMQVMNLRLMHEDDFSQVSFARAAGREVATWLSALLLMIGYIMIAFTAKRQALHDKLASTVVVRDAR